MKHLSADPLISLCLSFLCLVSACHSQTLVPMPHHAPAQARYFASLTDAERLRLVQQKQPFTGNVEMLLNPKLIHPQNNMGEFKLSSVLQVPPQAPETLIWQDDFNLNSSAAMQREFAVTSPAQRYTLSVEKRPGFPLDTKVTVNINGVN